MVRRRSLLATLGAVALAGCPGGNSGTTPLGTPATPVGDVDVTSSAFDHGEPIPERYTGDGEAVSPPLVVADLPPATEALAIIVDDPDAPEPPFTHWLLWNLPADTTTIPEGVPHAERLPSLGGARQGENDFGELGYRGPLPPSDDGPHRYRFTVAAIEATLSLQAGADRAALDEALSGMVVDRGRLVGTYNR